MLGQAMVTGSFSDITVLTAGASRHLSFERTTTMAIINGDNNNNFILGTADPLDIIHGWGGDDYIIGGQGADWIYGDTNGTYGDTASYTDSSQGVTIFMETANPYGMGFGGTAQGDRLYGIENVSGSAHSDSLFGDANDNKIHGNGGDDTLKGGGGADTLNGGFGIDTASYVNATSAVFIDLINGNGHWDEAEGDTLSSVENVVGSDYNDHLWGNSVANELIGGEGHDSLKGGGGADVLKGGLGNDTMQGGEGNDDYYVDSQLDVITEYAGVSDGNNDRVFVTVDNYVLTAANVETVSLTAGNAITVTGSSQNNTIIGNAQHNVINGGGNSAVGGDSLTGGGGFDTFVFQAGQAHGDTIYDFTGNGGAVGDSLQFSGYGTAAAGATFVHLGGNDWQVNSADGTIHETIVVLGAVNASDFVFV
jgi:Ca2+-binding RTX toxin-like protein